MLNNATLTSIKSVSEFKPNLVNVSAKEISKVLKRGSYKSVKAWTLQRCLSTDLTKVLKRGPYKSVKAQTLQKC